MIFAVKCRALILVNFRNCVSLSDPNVVHHFHLISFETIHSHCVGLLGAPSEVPSVYSHIDIHIKSNICNCIFPRIRENDVGRYLYPGGISKTVTTDSCARQKLCIMVYHIGNVYVFPNKYSCSDRQQICEFELKF